MTTNCGQIKLHQHTTILGCCFHQFQEIQIIYGPYCIDYKQCVLDTTLGEVTLCNHEMMVNIECIMHDNVIENVIREKPEAFGAWNRFVQF